MKFRKTAEMIHQVKIFEKSQEQFTNLILAIFTLTKTYNF